MRRPASTRTIARAHSEPPPPIARRARPADSGAVWHRIARELGTSINAGRLSAGDRLPTEASLAERYQVNRQTVRLAIADLARRGMVRTVPRNGTFVLCARISFTVERHTRFWASLRSAGRRPANVMLSAHETTAPTEMAAWLGLPAKARVMEIDTLCTANGMPVSIARSWFPADRLRRIGDVFARTGSFCQALERLGVGQSTRRQSRITARTCTEYERHVLELEAGATVLVLETLFVDGYGEPVQAAQSCFPADQVELLMPSAQLDKRL